YTFRPLNSDRMHGMRFSILTALAAFLVGIATGHYFSSSPQTTPRAKSEQPVAEVETSLPPIRTMERSATPSPSESPEKRAPASAESLIADIKAAVARSGTRRSYVAFSK